MISMILEFISGIFYWCISLIEHVAGDITMPKWLRIAVVAILACVFICVGIALIRLVIGIGTVLLVVLGVLIAIFFTISLIYAIIELVRNRF